jgi:acetyl-CoA carboxylase carboxyl transferase subunit beta
VPECSSASERIAALCAAFEPFPVGHDGEPVGDGPLGWPDYGTQRERAARATGRDDSVVCGRARLGEHDAVLIVFEFGFLGGSVGQAAGARIVSAFERARRERLPLVSLIASGGSRMQEGICALMELHRISRACALTRQAGIPHIAVACHPTTGGMWAALGAGADIVLATPHAAIAFGGSRVRDGTGADFAAEGKLDSGQVDRIVPDSELPAVLARLVALLSVSPLPGRQKQPAPAAVPDGRGAQELPRTGWEAVRRARSADRPRADAYLDPYFNARVELGGDRAGGLDSGMLCGIGRRHGDTIGYVAQTGTANTAAGFRAAARTIRLADQLRLPVLTLVDTPGAAMDAEAERQAVGPAIAEVFAAVAEASVPITTLVIGEGGSGGALALCSPDRTWITRDAYFAVITPESIAAILKHDQDEVPRLADQSRLRPQDLLDLGFVRGIV